MTHIFYYQDQNNHPLHNSQFSRLHMHVYFLICASDAWTQGELHVHDFHFTHLGTQTENLSWPKQRRKCLLSLSALLPIPKEVALPLRAHLWTTAASLWCFRTPQRGLRYLFPYQLLLLHTLASVTSGDNNIVIIRTKKTSSSINKF